MNILDGLKYAKSDEWIKVEGGTGTIGISDFAQDSLSDIVYVELPDVGSVIAKGEMFGSIESVKAASDLYLPVSGEVIEVNESLSSTPEIVNSDPFGKAWMLKIKISDTKELDGLMDADAYRKFCEEREK
jgi:glycine cleavage system H protein